MDAAMSDEIQQAIIDNATGPKRVTGDEGSVEQHSLQDQIAADRHVSSQAAASKPHRGLRRTKIIPAGPD